MRSRRPEKASTDQYRLLMLTPLGRAVMTGHVEEVRMLVPRTTRTRAPRRAESVGGRDSARIADP